MEKLLLPSPTTEEVKNTLLEIKTNMLSGSEKITTLVAIKYNKLSLLKPLWFLINEICECLILNKQCAAMTLTNHLLESSLKLTLILFSKDRDNIDETADFDTMYADEISDFQGAKMKDNLKVAKEKNIIDEDERNDLQNMMLEYRHHISHASNNKYVRNAKTKIWIYDYSTANTSEKEVGVMGNPSLNMLALEQFMRQKAFNYFTHVYAYIAKWDKLLSEKIIENQ